MKYIATFYTFFWIVYYPMCIAFYNDTEGGFAYIDEIMTLILIVFTFMNTNNKSTNKAPWKEYRLFLVILFAYLGYSFVMRVNTPTAAMRDLVQWIRPFSVIYCTWILNPRFIKWQKRLMLTTMVITLAFWLLTNRTSLEKEGAEFVVLGQLAMCTGMAWYILTKPTYFNLYMAVALMATGMFAPKFKYLGEVAIFVYMMIFMHKKIDFKSPRTIWIFSLLAVVILYVTWFKFEAYYVSGFHEGAERMARPESFKTAFGKIIWDYFPFGSGMGTFGVAAAAKIYSPLYYKYNLSDIWGLSPDDPMFLADAFYPTLAQFGVVGICLFIIYWKRRLVAMNKIIDMRYYRVAWISFFCLAIEQMADTSFLSGKGMGYCMLIGLCLNANRNLIENIKRTKKYLNKQEKLTEANIQLSKKGNGLWDRARRYREERTEIPEDIQ